MCTKSSYTCANNEHRRKISCLTLLIILVEVFILTWMINESEKQGINELEEDWGLYGVNCSAFGGECTLQVKLIGNRYNFPDALCVVSLNILPLSNSQ